MTWENCQAGDQPRLDFWVAGGREKSLKPHPIGAKERKRKIAERSKRTPQTSKTTQSVLDRSRKIKYKELQGFLLEGL